MLSIYKSIADRVFFFIIFSIFSFIFTLVMYFVMEFYFRYQVENLFLFSVGTFFIGGAVFDNGFKFLLHNEQVTDTGEEYMLLFIALLIVLIPTAMIANKYVGFEMTTFLFTNLFMGCVSWFILLSEKTVKKKENNFKIFAK